MSHYHTTLDELFHTIREFNTLLDNFTMSKKTQNEFSPLVLKLVWYNKVAYKSNWHKHTW